MKDDPIVENVREIRDAYAAEFNYDLKALYEDIKRQEQANQKPHHRLTPKRIACFSVAELRNRNQKPGFFQKFWNYGQHRRRNPVSISLVLGQSIRIVSFCVGFGNYLPECECPYRPGRKHCAPTPYTLQPKPMAAPSPDKLSWEKHRPYTEF